MRLQILREQEKQLIQEKKQKQNDYEKYKEIQEQKRKLKELYAMKLEEKRKLELQKQQIQQNYENSLQEMENQIKLDKQKQIEQHKRRVQIESNNIIREKKAYEFLKRKQVEKFEFENKQKLLRQKALDQEKQRTEKILQAYQLKKKSKRKYVIKQNFENQDQIIDKYKNQNSRLGFKFYKENNNDNAFEQAQQEKMERQNFLLKKEKQLEQTQNRAQESIKKMLQQRENNEKNSIMEYHRIETNLIKLQQNKEDQFAKNKKIVEKKKKKKFEQKLNKEYLPELEKINKILVKKNFQFLDNVAKKRKCFYMLKDNLFKVEQLNDDQRVLNIELDYSKSDKEIQFDITQSQDQIQKNFSEVQSIDIKKEITNQSDSSFGNLSDFDIKAFLEQEQKFLEDLNNSNEQKNDSKVNNKNPPKNFKKKSNANIPNQNIEKNEDLIKEKIENKFVKQINNSIIQEEKSEDMSQSSEQKFIDLNSKNSSQRIKIKDVISNKQSQKQKIQELLDKHNISISEDSEDENQNDYLENFKQQKTQLIQESQPKKIEAQNQQHYDVNITVKKKDQEELKRKKELLDKRKNYKPKMFQKKRKSQQKKNQKINQLLQSFYLQFFSY